MSVKVIGEKQGVRLERRKVGWIDHYYLFVDNDLELVMDGATAESMRRLLNKATGKDSTTIDSPRNCS